MLLTEWFGSQVITHGMIPLIISAPLLIIVSANIRCSTELPPILPKYYLLEKCHRSKLGAVARANYTSLASCRRLGIQKRALAFNFSPREAMNLTEGNMEYSCEVLNCAEVSGGSSLTNDTRFDYYSIYAKPIPRVNSTCVPATGMFHLLDQRLNHSQAAASCRNLTAVLAHVGSEQSTLTLSQVVAGAGLDAAYVGMRRLNTTAFFNTNGDSLDCSTYRAWAPGHPKRKYTQYDCAVLTRHRTWRSVPCGARHAALCELIPGGPYRLGSIFSQPVQDKVAVVNMPSSIVT